MTTLWADMGPPDSIISIWGTGNCSETTRSFSIPDSGSFYYREQRLSLTKEEDVARRLKTALRKKQPYFVFHWRGGKLNRELVRFFYEEACRTAEEKGKFAALSVNVPQSVIEIAIRDRQAEKEIQEEDANEGELTEQ